MKHGQAIGVIFALIVFSIIAKFFPGPGVSDEILGIFQVASFLFGIFVGFAISNSISRFNKISEALKSDEGKLLSVYHLSSSFGEKVQRKVLAKIDEHLVQQVDYFLKDFRRSNDSFVSLYRMVLKLKPKGKVQEKSYDTMVEQLTKIMEDRKLVETYIAEPMLRLEWASILVLLCIILFCIGYMNTGTLSSIITSVLLSVSTILIIIVLKTLEDLKWKEGSWIWDDLENLFRDLGLLPYYPRLVIDSGRAKIKGKARVASYPNPYPDMAGKTVSIVEIE
jgi:hypothetical protein